MSCVTVAQWQPEDRVVSILGVKVRWGGAGSAYETVSLKPWDQFSSAELQ